MLSSGMNSLNPVYYEERHMTIQRWLERLSILYTKKKGPVKSKHADLLQQFRDIGETYI